MRPIALAVLFYCFCADSAPLKGFSVEFKNFSQELELVAAQLAASESLSMSTATEVAAAAEVINSDIKKIPKANALFLIKSEIYKGLLNNPLLEAKDELLLNESLVKGIEKKLDKHKIIYTDFSAWLVESLLLELAPFRKDNFLDRYQTVSGNDVESRAKALKLRKLTKYLSPWLMAFNENTPEEFNRLATQVSAGLIKRIASKTYYFREFASNHAEDSLPPLFSIPTVKPPEQTVAPLPSASLKQESEKIKAREQEVLEKLKGEDLENPSEVIENFVNQQDADGGDGEAWKPK